MNAPEFLAQFADLRHLRVGGSLRYVEAHAGSISYVFRLLRLLDTPHLEQLFDQFFFHESRGRALFQLRR
jgi:hypothetical protein